MTRSIDPFEEYLRKKKVELLERQYREQQAESLKEAESEVEEQESFAVADADPEAEARLREEMDDFFESGQVAAAKLFNEASGLDEEKVEEIKEALDEVFEEDAPQPQTDPDGDTFVEFFKQIKQDYESGRRGPQEFTQPAAGSGVVAEDLLVGDPPPAGPRGAERPAPEDRRASQEPAAVETVAGIPGPSMAVACGRPAALEPESLVERPPAAVVEEVPAPPVNPGAEMDPAAGTVQSDPLPFRDEFEATAAEVSSEDPTDSIPLARVSDRLNLAEILLGGVEETVLEQRVEVLCRVLTKLVERTGLPQSDLIEALIKSDVEF